MNELDRALLRARDLGCSPGQLEQEFLAHNEQAQLFADKYGSSLLEYIRLTKQSYQPPLPQTGLSIQQRRSPAGTKRLCAGDRNSVLACEISGNVNVHILKKVFNIVMARHGALRTKYHVSLNDEMKGSVLSRVEPDIEVFYLGSGEDSQTPEEILLAARDWAFRDTDLAASGHLRCRVVRTTNCTIVVVSLLHFVSDAHSLDILFAEIQALYRDLASGQEPTSWPTSSSYDTYVRRQGDSLMNGEWVQQKVYWEEVFHNSEALRVPTPFRGRPEGAGVGSLELFRMSVEDIARLREIAKEEKCNIEVVIFAIVAISCAIWSDQERYRLFTIYHGRDTLEDHVSIGLYMLSFPVPIECPKNATFREILRTIFSTWRELIKDGGLPAHLAMMDGDIETGRGFGLQANFAMNLDLPAKRAPIANGTDEWPVFRRLPMPRKDVSDPTAGIDMYLLVTGNREGVRGLMYHAYSIVTLEGMQKLGMVFSDFLRRTIKESGTNEVL